MRLLGGAFVEGDAIQVDVQDGALVFLKVARARIE